MTIQARHFLYAALALLLAPSIALSSAPLVPCNDDADCSEGETCVHYDGPCVLLHEDCEGEDCQPEDLCTGVASGICMPEYEETYCESDADCAEGEVCVYFYTSPCVLPEDCGEMDCADEDRVGCQDAVTGMCLPVYEETYCESDADCAEGDVCVRYEIPCAVLPIECDEDGCEDLDIHCGEASSGVCLPDFDETYCATDADCAEGEVCVHFFGIPCALPDCDGAEDCSDAELMDCGPAMGICMADYFEETCESDADCMEGYECVLDHSCVCSSSADDPSEPECYCEPSDVGYCMLKNIVCEDESDCPAGWTCEELAAVQPCYTDSSGIEVCADLLVIAESLCVPPGEDAELLIGRTDGDGKDHQKREAGSEPLEPGSSCSSAASGTSSLFALVLMVLGLAASRRSLAAAAR